MTKIHGGGPATEAGQRPLERFVARFSKDSAVPELAVRAAGIASGFFAGLGSAAMLGLIHTYPVALTAGTLGPRGAIGLLTLAGAAIGGAAAGAWSRKHLPQGARGEGAHGAACACVMCDSRPRAASANVAAGPSR